MSLLPENLKYALSHEWANEEAQHIVRVGITDFAQEELGDLVYVELPDVGRRVDANESCATVESVKTASDIASPVSGEIVDINTAVVDDPEKINDDPYGAWLFCMKTDSLISIIDNDIDKQGKRLYGTLLPVESAESLRDKSDILVLVNAAGYTDEIKEGILTINPRVRFF